jgi:hypothetical protein
MSLHSIKAVGTRDNGIGTGMGKTAQGTGITLRGGPVGDPGRGQVYRWITCGRKLCSRTPLSIRAPLGRMVGGVHRELRVSWRRAPETENVSLWALCEGNLEGGHLYWGPWRYVEEGSGDEHLSIGVPMENLEGGSYTEDVKDEWRRALEMGNLYLRGLYEGNMEGVFLFRWPRKIC